FGVFVVDRHVAREYEHRRTRRIGGGNRADHVGEARTFSPRGGCYFSGHPGERIGRVTHRAFVAPRVGPYAFNSDRILDVALSRTAKKRRESFFFADPGKDLRPGHREARLCGSDLRSLGKRLGDLYRSAFGDVGSVRSALVESAESGDAGAGDRTREEL